MGLIESFAKEEMTYHGFDLWDKVPKFFCSYMGEMAFEFMDRRDLIMLIPSTFCEYMLTVTFIR